MSSNKQFKDQVKKRIGEIIRRDLSTVTDDTALRDLVAESFVLVEVVIDLQETFGVRLVQEDLMNVTELGHLLDLIERKKTS